MADDNSTDNMISIKLRQVYSMDSQLQYEVESQMSSQDLSTHKILISKGLMWIFGL